MYRPSEGGEVFIIKAVPRFELLWRNALARIERTQWAIAKQR